MDFKLRIILYVLFYFLFMQIFIVLDFRNMCYYTQYYYVSHQHCFNYVIVIDY